jgi:hypothetical protein
MKVLITILSTLVIFIGCGGGSSDGSGSVVINRDIPEVIEAMPSPKAYSFEKVEEQNCDKDRAEVQIIQTDDDWKQIKNQTKTVFCVQPNMYNKVVSIENRSGTADKPLYIVLNNGNDKHPAELNATSIANIKFYFKNSNHWVIDRMASVGSSSLDDHPMIFENSSNNVINRFFMDKTSEGIAIRDNSNANTIQNSRFQNMSEMGRKNDRSCIILEPRNSTSAIKNTHILNNELHNCNDGIHLLWRDNISKVAYDGTVIYKNDISIDSSLYTDCKGNLNPNGECSYSENAIDIKSGSYDSKNPIVIWQNHLWGFRKADKTNSTLGDPGVALVMHYGVRNVIIQENMIFDAVQGVLSIDAKSQKHALVNAKVLDNLIFNVKIPLIMNEAYGIEVSNNYVVAPEKAWLVLKGSDTIVADNNMIVNKQSGDGIEYKMATNFLDNNNNYGQTTKIRDDQFKTDKFTSSRFIIPATYTGN